MLIKEIARKFSFCQLRKKMTNKDVCLYEVKSIILSYLKKKNETI